MTATFSMSINPASSPSEAISSAKSNAREMVGGRSTVAGAMALQSQSNSSTCSGASTMNP